MARELEQQEESSKGFNLQVHFRDEKTGLVTHTDPYVLHEIADRKGGKNSYCERRRGPGTSS